MNRVKLSMRKLPDYTRGEETFNMVSHIVGGGIGVVATVICVIIAALNRNVWGIVGGAIYGFTLILLFTMSSVYHGLKSETPKKVFQVLDHCTIFILISGTYTPILLGKFREAYPLEAWLIFGVIWGLAILGVVLNSIDLKRYNILSLVCYLGMGWLCIFRISKFIEVLGGQFCLMLLIGGLCYTIGAVFYCVGWKKKYMHSVFHIFIDLGALMHFLGIAVFVMPG